MKKEKYTLKQIREWFRKLEENKYRKRYMVDAKRVHHYVNLGEDTDLPTSLQRKTGTYGREKQLAKQITNSIKIPTIGIGSSNNCDGQILVTDDILGLTESKYRFIKKFTDIKKQISKGAKKFKEEVKSKKYPKKKHSY